jgi:hypothetical protein
LPLKVPKTVCSKSSLFFSFLSSDFNIFEHWMI